MYALQEALPLERATPLIIDGLEVSLLLPEELSTVQFSMMPDDETDDNTPASSHYTDRESAFEGRIERCWGTIPEHDVYLTAMRYPASKRWIVKEHYPREDASGPFEVIVIYHDCDETRNPLTGDMNRFEIVRDGRVLQNGVINNGCALTQTW